jgi:CMP/dCMP kinase
MIIAIDGPSGTGKSSVAKAVAKRLGFECFDTGAMYRAFTLEILDHPEALKNTSLLEEVLNHFQFSIKDGDHKRYFIGDREVTEEIRSLKITEHVSEVAALKPVREKLVYFQKKFAEKKNAVFEGRDMGTVVFPDADLKLFLNASAGARAQRRFLELQAKGGELPSFDEVLSQIEKRDAIDSSRAHSPLRKADDAIEIDTTELSLNEVIDLVEKVWREKC